MLGMRRQQPSGFWELGCGGTSAQAPLQGRHLGLYKLWTTQLASHTLMVPFPASWAFRAHLFGFKGGVDEVSGTQCRHMYKDIHMHISFQKAHIVPF